MGFWTDLLGTTSTSFKIGKAKATFDASGLSAARTFTLPDAAGTLARTSDITGTNSGTNTGDETGARIATLHHAATAKTSLVDADEITGQDSAASFGLIRTTWTNVKAFLKTYFDTLYISTAGNYSWTNRVHNGDMRVQQRGSSGIAPTNAYQYSVCDRHLIKIAGGTSISGTISTTTYTASTASEILFGVNTGTWTTGNFTFQHRIEAQNTVDITQQPFTVSCLVYQNTGGARNFKIDIGKPTTTADTFSAQTVLQTSSATSVPSGTVTAVSATFTLSNVSDPALGLFITVYDSDSANTVSGKVYAVGQLAFKIGSTATAFEKRPYSVELELCQRYLPVFTGTGPCGQGHNLNTTVTMTEYPFRVPARVSPTGITVANPTNFSVWDGTGSTIAVTSIGLYSAGNYGAYIEASVASGLTAQRESGLLAGNANCAMFFTGAEL